MKKLRGARLARELDELRAWDQYVGAFERNPAESRRNALHQLETLRLQFKLFELDAAEGEERDRLALEVGKRIGRLEKLRAQVEIEAGKKARRGHASARENQRRHQYGRAPGGTTEEKRRWVVDFIKQAVSNSIGPRALTYQRIAEDLSERLNPGADEFGFRISARTVRRLYHSDAPGRAGRPKTPA